MGSGSNRQEGRQAVAIYTKHGKRVLQETIRIDADCFIGDKVFKFRAVVEGQRVAHLYYVADLLADGGKTEIQDEIRALMSKVSEPKWQSPGSVLRLSRPEPRRK